MQNVSGQRRQQSYSQGDQAEEALANLIRERGSLVAQHPRNTRRNYADKVDLDVVTRSGQRFAIEVKSKKNNIGGNVLLETVGSKGFPGWLCGQADFIAQETHRQWLFYRRQLALDYLVAKYGDYKTVSIQRLYAYEEKPIRQWIGRKGNSDYGTVQQDVFILIPYEELLSELVSIRMNK